MLFYIDYRNTNINTKFSTSAYIFIEIKSKTGKLA